MNSETQKRFSYSVYGLHLCANRPIFGLTNTELVGEPDVEIWLDSIPPWMETGGVEEQSWYVSAHGHENSRPTLRVSRQENGGHFHFEYMDGTQFFLDRNGTQIWSTWRPDFTLEDAAVYLIGPVLGFVLRLKGVTSLHASAVVVDGEAIAIVGPAGAGKSTTAAALAEQGYAVIAEDVVALSTEQRALMVQSGYPQVRLWPESSQVLWGSAEMLPCITPNWDKRYLNLTTNGYRFERQPVPLSAVYLLGARSSDPQAPFINDMPARAALMSLVANTYVNYLLDEEMRAREFSILTRLISQVPVKEVIPSADPARLPRLCYAIVDDFQKRSKPSVAGAML